jgi:hypothetical protein
VTITKLALQKLLHNNLLKLEPVQKDIPVDAKVTQTTDAKGRVSVDVKTTDGDVYMPNQWALAIAKSISESLYNWLVGTQYDGVDAFITTPAFTALVTDGVFEKIEGTFARGLGLNFTVSADGRFTYTGSITKWFDVSVVLSVDSGFSGIYLFRIAKNGATLSASEQQRSISGVNDVGNVNVLDRVELKTNDYIEIFAAPDFTHSSGGTTAIRANVLIR